MKSLTKKIFITLITGLIIVVLGAWGMGDMFSTGNKNVVATIGGKKIYVNEYINVARGYIRKNNKNQLSEKDHSLILNSLLSQKVYENFAHDLNIKINDKALAYFIKNDENFKDDKGVFSRVEYEKYLLINNLNSLTVENFYKKELIKRIIVEVFINGVSDTKYHTLELEREFLKQVEVEYYEISNNDKISTDNITNYFSKNKLKFSLGEMRDGKFARLTEQNLGFTKESDQFYKSLDNIENDLVNNLSFNDLVKKYNLKTESINKINLNGLNTEREVSENNIFAQPIFSLKKNLNTEIFELNNVKYLIKMENIYPTNTIKISKKIEDEIIKILNLKNKKKISLEILSNKQKFYDFANSRNIKIKSVQFKNILDNKKLFNQRNMEKIFNNKINTLINLNENNSVYMIKIKNISQNKDKVENLQIILKSQIKKEFQSLILRDLDSYLIKKYPIELNNKVFNQVKKNI